MSNKMEGQIFFSVIMLQARSIQGITTGFNEVGLCECTVCFHSMVKN
jgi:hypothetical protein